MRKINKPLTLLLATATLTTSIAAPAVAVSSTNPTYLQSTLQRTIEETAIYNETQSLYFATLSEAFDEAQEGDVIVLQDNIDITELGATLTGKALTLDLNGNSVTTYNDADRNITVSHNATLTVKDSATGGTIATLAAFEEGTGYRGVIDVKGTFILESGTISSAVSRGILVYSHNEGLEDYFSSVIINGGKVQGAEGHYGIQNAKGNATMLGNTTISVNGGEVSSILSSYTGYPRHHDVDISGGIVGDITMESSDLALEAGVVPQLSITGGIVEGDLIANTYEDAHTADGKSISDYFNFSVTGGLFATPPESFYLPTGYDVDEVNEEGYYPVLDKTTDLILEGLANVDNLDPETDQETINALAAAVSTLDMSELTASDEIVEALNTLDALFIAANPTVSIIPTSPTTDIEVDTDGDDDVDDDTDDGIDDDEDDDTNNGVDDGIDDGIDTIDTVEDDSEDDIEDDSHIEDGDDGNRDDRHHIIPDLAITPAGLALSVLGGTAPDEETALYLSIHQEHPTGEEDVRLSITPQQKIGDEEATEVPNSALTTPITFPIYLPSTFSADATHALVVHETERRDANSFTNPILTDELDNRYVSLTVTEFSTFTITAVTSDSDTLVPEDDEDEGNTGGGSGGGVVITYFDISITSEGNGKTSPSGDIKIGRGNSRTISFIPDSGYEVADVILNGESIGAMDSYSFRSVGAHHTLHVIFTSDELFEEDVDAPELEPTALPFTDVKENDWYYDGVQFVYEHGLMNGTSATTFSPSVTTTRGMIATILHRLSGEESVSFDMTFADVGSDMYYYDAIRWAQATGVVTGHSDEIFAPDEHITREQLATLLHRYAQLTGMELSEVADKITFDDNDEISDWATQAVATMQTAGVINGKDNNRFDPQGLGTRGEAATMLMRFLSE